MEEIPVFLIAVGIAVATLGLMAWLISGFNVAAPVERAYAFLYPWVRPYNATHAMFGVEPIGGAPVAVKAVEIGGVVYPVGKTVRNLTWLMAVPCGANVTVVSQYGTAQRADKWQVACIQRSVSSIPREILDQLIKQLLKSRRGEPRRGFRF